MSSVKSKSVKKAEHFLEGELRFSIPHLEEKALITLIQYNGDEFIETTIDSVDDMIIPDEHSEYVYWYNIDGVSSPSQMSEIEQKYNLHALLMEDVMSVDQRPKMDDYDDCLFVTVKMMRFNKDKKRKHILSEQLSIVLRTNLILSFQENKKKGDVFDSHRERLRQNKAKVRKKGADYLLYCMLDTVVDHYFTIIELLGDKLEVIEQDMMANPDPAKLGELYRFRRELIYLRKSVWPLREVIAKLERDDLPLISDEVTLYLRDVYDHTIHVIESVESYRDILAGIVDVYLSSESNKMNSVMKVLTIISTIFMPLAFITGVFGMNFDHMPELHTQYGYYAVLGVCFLSAVGMLMYFRKKKWL